MNKLFKVLSVLMVIAYLLTACIPPVVDVARAAPEEVSYRAVLGKPASDQSVAEFIASNDCAPSGSFRLCGNAGLALWLDERGIVKKAYLYAQDSGDFSAYKGELPFGLEAGDRRAEVELKLGHPLIGYAAHAGWEPGRPEEGSSPDDLHFWAVYRRFGLTIIYDTPSAEDRNAAIHAILVSR